MAKLQWKDITSYQRGDKECKPTTFEIEHGNLRICVVFGHLLRPGEWVCHCQVLGMDTEHLPGVKNAEEAKAAAIELVQANLRRLQLALNEIKRVK